jgi:outer membrane protein
MNTDKTNFADGPFSALLRIHDTHRLGCAEPINLCFICVNQWLNILLLFLFFVTSSNAEVVTKERMPLTIHDCIELALENNLEIAVERLNPKLDLAQIKTLRGDFDPAIVLNPSYSENTTSLDAQSAVAAGGRLTSQSRVTSLGAGIEGKVPTGTTYHLGLQNDDRRNTFNSFNDQFTGYWGIDATQPLLKGFGTDTQLSRIRIARKQKDISVEGLNLKVMDIVTRTRISYYELYGAIQKQKLVLESLDFAAKLLENNRKRVEIGVSAPIEVTLAETGVAQREVNVISASQQVTEKMNELRTLISRDVSKFREKSLWPAETLSDAPLLDQELDDLYTASIGARPEYRQAKTVIDQKNLQIKYAQNQRYPQVDLKGTYGFNDLSSRFGDSFGTEDNRWFAGFVVRIPLPDQIGQGNLESSKLLKEQALLQLKQVEQKIFVEVDNAFEKAQSDFKRLQATRVATKYAKESLAQESMKFKTGTADSDDLLDKQNRVTDAQANEIDALVEYNVSLSQLEKAKGSTLEGNRIEVENSKP